MKGPLNSLKDMCSALHTQQSSLLLTVACAILKISKSVVSSDITVASLL